MLPQLESLNTRRGCCRHSDRTEPLRPPSAPASRWRNRWETAGGALSLGVWLLMPKCPMCVVAYAALWTGLGLSLTQATYLRCSLLFGSAALLAYLAVKRGARVIAARARSSEPAQ